MPHRLALHELHAAAGARFESVGVREVPGSYGDPAAEYTAVRQGVGLIDRSDSGIVEVRGRDRAAFLHAMLSNDVKGLAPGQGCAAGFLDVHGKVQVLLLVWALDDRILLVTPPGMAQKTLEDLDRYLFSEKAELADASDQYALLMLAGPGAPALAARLGDAMPPEPAWSHVTGNLTGADVRLVRGGGETGEPEVWVMARLDDAGRVWQALLGAGARPVGFEAGEALRIEAGTSVFGQDVDGSVLLPEIPSEPLVSYTKGCYLGQEVVVRIRDRGHVNRHLRGLLLEGEAVPPPGATLLADAAEVGRVTSAAWSFGLKRPVALGFVRRQHAEPGMVLTVRWEDRAVPATVSALRMPR